MSKSVNPVGGSGKKKGRDTACTPLWLAELIGTIGIDPCSNPRSHIKAHWRLMLEYKCNGLLNKEPPGTFKYGGPLIGWNTTRATEDWEAFINPPYARGQVIRWVRHWRHTRFVFLLRWDPSTDWFAELRPFCTSVWFPKERIQFDAPPGVKFSSNPYPHALYMRDPSPELVARLWPHGWFFK